MKSILSGKPIRAAVLFLLLAIFLPIVAMGQGAFYVEETKDGRIYVFNDPKAYQTFQQTGELEVRLSRIGAGPNGETIYFDSENAIHMYNWKHNLPAEVIIPATPAATPMQEKLPYKISGYTFTDYFYNVQRDDAIGTFSNVATPGAEDFNGFLIRRLYFTYDDDISPDFTARFRLEADTGTVATNNKISVFVKDAYLTWKNAIGMQNLTFGMQPTPAFEVSEAAWRYRSLEKTIMDLRGIVPSRDIAVSLKGRIDGAGKFEYWVMAGNGSGNTPETDKFKRFYFHTHWKPTEKFQATLYQDIKQAPQIVDPNNATGFIDNDSFTTGWFVNYGVKDKYSLGYEGFYTNTKNANKFGTVAPFTVDNRSTMGHSFWGWYDFNPMVGIVGRFDLLEPNSDGAGDKRNYFIGSLVLRPHKNIWIMPNLLYESYEDSASGVSFDASITPRITFYYIFL